MIITGKLINPQIIFTESGTPVYFDQTLVITDDLGNELQRNEVSWTWPTTDSVVTAYVQSQVAALAASYNDPSVTASTADVSWDWPANAPKE